LLCRLSLLLRIRTQQFAQICSHNPHPAQNKPKIATSLDLPS